MLKEKIELKNESQIKEDLKMKRLSTDEEIKKILKKDGLSKVDEVSEKLKDSIYDVGDEHGFTLDTIQVVYARIDKIVEEIKQESTDRKVDDIDAVIKNSMKTEKPDKLYEPLTESLSDELEIVDLESVNESRADKTMRAINDEPFSPLMAHGSKKFDEKVSSKWGEISTKNNLKRCFFKYNLKRKINGFLRKIGFKSDMISLEKERYVFRDAIRDVFLYANNLDEESRRLSDERRIDLMNKYHKNNLNRDKVTLYNHKI